MMMKVGFIYFDEIQHIHHFLSPAVELSRMPGFQVDILTYEGKHEYLMSLLKLMGGDRLNIVQHETYFYRKVIEKITGRKQPSALYLYKKHLSNFLKYDALVFTDRTAGEIHIHKQQSMKPYLIQLGHGAGDGIYGYAEAHNMFDLVLVSGQKKYERLNSSFPHRNFKIDVTGYNKFDVVKKEFTKQDLFGNENPIVLYSPHFKSNLSSWHSDGISILNYFKNNKDFNLIFAPHYNLFNKKGAKESRDSIRGYLGTPNIHVDTGSINSINMRYTLLSDIYLGDVSSQVYEFMIKARPIIYYNTHNIDWENDESYLMWKAGKVIQTIDELDQALRTLNEWPKEFEDEQRRLYEITFDETENTAGVRVAMQIKENLNLS
ncbi:MAG: CDP-glycerol glycerophosphotransferase family protein [Bacteroidota bacterium]